MPVLGIGGLFFRSADPEALAAWYKEHLGVGAGCNASGNGNPDDWYWQTEGGPTVFAPFKASSDDLDPAAAAFMINFRVDDLDSFIEELKGKGVEVLGSQAEEYGKFAWILDCDGIKLELWEQIGPAPV